MPEPPRSIHSECLKIDVKAPGLTTSAYLLSDRIRALFQTCQFFDVHLRVGNARFPAHQAVLAAMSDWLRLNLKSLLEEEEGSDQLPQIRLERISNPDAVMILLDAAYELGGEGPIPHAALADVLRLSHMFQLRRLEEQAVQSLAMEITGENVLERLDICVEFNLTFLYERILTHLHEQGLLLEVCKCPEMCCYPQLMQHMVMYLSTHDLK
ncbi:ARIA [Symbiodinium natans]|uniref:ARIA protein n=1 Tax=Symbiodinium natans TaxID=878477 RepID=A0A812Q351_9DINO|nr:ARIA [Symbiodinium natans]